MKYLFTILSSLVMTTLASFGADQFPDINHEQLKQAIQEKKVILLDVNGSSSWKEGHIPGAMDYAAIQEHLAAKLPKDKNALIVAYCGNEACPAYATAAKAAKELGYTNVKHYAPGIAGWKAKEKTEKGS